jgi:type IV pilus assembly protein PilE
MTNRTSLLSSRCIGGFTLIELMITVVVLAIIVGIAMPSYTLQIHKSRRTEARNALLDLAGREERFLSVSSSYSNIPTDVGYPGASWGTGILVGSGYYNVVVTVPDPNYVGPAGPSYLITATATGTQTSDTTCTTFSVNQVGQQTATNPECWQ